MPKTENCRLKNYYMKSIFLTLAILVATISSCKKDCNCTPGSTTPTIEKGTLLFWVNDPQVIPTCGALTVKLSNGMESTITGYYFSAPTSCVNQFGGYFYLDEGTYNYQVFPQNTACTSVSGTVTVIGGRCNFSHL